MTWIAIVVGAIMLGLSALFLVGGELPVPMNPDSLSFVINRNGHPLVFWLAWIVWTGTGVIVLLIGLGVLRH